MYTCDHCKEPIDQYKERWGNAKTQNDDGDPFSVIAADGTIPDFEFRVVCDDDVARHYHFICACTMLTLAMAEAVIDEKQKDSE